MKWSLVGIFLIGVVGIYAFSQIKTVDTSIVEEEFANKPRVEGAYASTTQNINKKKTTTDIVLPKAKFIPDLAWVGQSFNNCSSVGLMITLSHWGINDTQEAIAEATRPWNNPKGNNDDKSVTLHELAYYAKTKYGTRVYVRPNGDIETLKKFVANDIPVLTRALMYPKDDIVHYRVIRGYDDDKRIVIETDGIEGKKRPYSYDDWMHMWKDFNYSYLIIVPEEKKALAEKLLGEDLDEKTAWKNVLAKAESQVVSDNNDIRAQYNKITALYYLDDYNGTIREFEKIESKLTRRKLWYQSEPIEAYFKVGNYERVMELVNYMANDNNKSISELYVLKGKIYEERGDMVNAKAEYTKALFYNKHLQSAKDALASITN